MTFSLRREHRFSDVDERSTKRNWVLNDVAGEPSEALPSVMGKIEQIILDSWPRCHHSFIKLPKEGTWEMFVLKEAMYHVWSLHNIGFHSLVEERQCDFWISVREPVKSVLPDRIYGTGLTCGDKIPDLDTFATDDENDKLLLDHETLKPSSHCQLFRKGAN